MKLAAALVLHLLLAVATAAASPDPIEGKWVGTAGPPDNRAVFALEIKRDAAGALGGTLCLDRLNYYNQPLPSFHVAEGKFTVPEFGLELSLQGDRLVGTLGGPAAPVELRRTDRLPAEPPLPDVPAGPDPLWQAQLGSAIYATAAVHEGFAYVGTLGGVFHAVKTGDGSLAWTFGAGRPILGEALATDDAVYFTCDNGRLYKLERATGRELWHYDLGDALVPRILPHPAVFDYDHDAPTPVLAEGVLYVGSGDGGFHAVRADTGQRVWRIDAPGKIRGTAAVHGAQVVFGTLDGPIVMVERATGRETWRFDSKAAVTSSPVFLGETLVVGNRGSVLYGLDPADGSRRWRQSWWGSWIESTAAPAGKLACIGSSDYRRVTCFDPRDGRVEWATDVHGWSWARPLVTEHTVYAATAGASPYMIRHLGGLCALDRATGRLRWRRPVAQAPGSYTWGFAAGCALDRATVVVGGLDGTLYAFPAE